MTSFSGLTAIVTGAAGAMGEQEARMFAERGANVVLTDVRADEGTAIADDIGKSAVFVPHDVSSESGWNTVIETALSAFGSVNVLVNNAAISKAIKLIDTDVDTFDLFYRINQLGVYLGMKSVVEPMKAVGGGSIINISSGAGTGPVPGSGHYGAAKAGVNSLTWTLSAEFAPNIRVNGVMPGAIPTEVMLQAVGKNEDQLDELLEEWRIPLGRLGTPQDIGSVCVYLASEAASWVSGEIIRVGGGAKPR